MPPIAVATISPLANSVPGADSTDCLNAQDARKLDVRRMALTGEKLGAIEPECFDSYQDFAALRSGDRKALNFENLRSARFTDHSGFHSGHHLPPSSLCARWVGGGKAVTGDLPVSTYFLEQEEFLIGLRTSRACRVNVDRPGRVSTSEYPVRGYLHNLLHVELDAQLDVLEHRLVRLADRLETNTRRTVLRHEHAVRCVELHDCVGIGLIQRVLISGKYFGNGLLVCIHDSHPFFEDVSAACTIVPRPFM